MLLVDSYVYGHLKGRDSSVGIVTGYGLDGPGIESQCYERATGALLNVRKSQALAVGTWDPERSVLVSPYSEVIKILGFQLNKTEISRRASWSRVTAKVKTHASEAYHRDNRIAYFTHRHTLLTYSMEQSPS
jgi:hypothetical protein